VKSFITHLNDNQKIVVMKSVGMWSASDVLPVVQDALALEPDYLIWDPTEMVFPADHRQDYQDSSEERQKMTNLLASALNDGRLVLYLIIRRKVNTSFETMRGISRSLHIEDKVRFVKSLDEAEAVIAEHQMYRRAL